MSDSAGRVSEWIAQIVRRAGIDHVFERLGIRRLTDQITLVFGVALAVTVGTLTVIWVERYVHLAMTERHAAADAVSQSVAALAADAVITRDLPVIERVTADAARFPGITGVDVLGIDGRLLATAGTGGAGASAIGKTNVLRPPPASSSADRSFDQGERWLKIDTGSTPAWVRVRYDLDVIAKARWEIWGNAAFTAVVSIIGTVLLLRLLLLRPMGLISETARFAALLARRKGATLNVDVGPREVLLLRQSLNDASLNLARQEDELRAVNERLEQRVAERTEELSRTIETLKQAQQQLIQAEKMAGLGTLAGGIAHEINTPAQFLNSNLQFLESTFADLGRVLSLIDARLAASPPTETWREMADLLAEIDAEFIKAEVPMAISQSKEGLARIAEIVHAIKTYAHPQHTQFEIIDLPAAVHAAVTITRNQWKHVAEMELDLADDAAEIEGQPGGINQVLLNLIVNAAHAIVEKRGGMGRIRIATRRIGPDVELSVEDNGTGINPKDLSRVFDPFFTTKSVGKGTGQGLTICHAIVTAHGGTITAASEPGRNTLFTIRIPQKNSARDSPAAS